MGSCAVPVVIVADDFGHSPAINEGILQAFEEGLISATSIMANMPAFTSAVAAASRAGLADRVGVHLNVSEGQALSSGIRQCPRFADSDGNLHWHHRMVWSLSESETAAVTAEWRAQIEAVVHAGLRPTHLDSHHHTHTTWPLGTIVLQLAREFEVPTIRLSRNCGPVSGLPVRIYKTLYNGRLHRARRNCTQYFGHPLDVRDALGRATGPVEVMTHPTIAPDGRLINHTDGRALAELIDGLNLRGEAVPFSRIS